MNNGGNANPSNPANFNGNGCKTSLDSLMMIYRLIQASQTRQMDGTRAPDTSFLIWKM